MPEAKVMSNFDAIGELVGSFVGMSEALNEDDYMEGLIRQAHGKAANTFNIAAAATASAGHLHHVFEFGTAGITPGRPVYPDPTSPAARLWVHTLMGHGGNQDIGYAFRPAQNPNPQPTTASTGVPSKYLSRLSKRKYIFFNKAYVMETGQTVEIHAKNGDYLFVPFYGEGSKNPSNNKGFTMYNTSTHGPIVSTPGRTTKGTFTAFWMNWWASAGNEIIAKDMEISVIADIEAEVAATVARANAVTVKPSRAARVNEKAAKARKLVERTFGIKRRNNKKVTV